ncbi:MAG: hypothetical protein JWN08_1229 [Frankiales bacterium]|nr:hypothetical protein [Frankiales bacterium]
MLKKLTLAAGFGAGYVLGAKAGREKYVQIEAKFRELAGKPAVQHATTSVKETASGLADTAKTTVTEKVGAVTDKASGTTKDPVIDLAATTPTGARTTSTPTPTPPPVPTPAPMAGATSSGSAPDITRP